MREFQGVAISEAPLLFRALLFTGATVLVVVCLIGALTMVRKWKNTKVSAPKWVDWVSRLAIALIVGSVLVVGVVYSTRHWLDYIKKDYCVYTGSYEVREERIRRSRGEEVAFVAVLPDGNKIDISMGDVGYTTGTLVYTARTNILLGYDDSIVITPDK